MQARTRVVRPERTIDVPLPQMSEFRYSAAECLASIGPHGPSQAVPHVWMKPWLAEKTMRVEVPILTTEVLNSPFIFGGHIEYRNGLRHRHHQLLIDRECEIDQFSYGIMDGVYSLPEGLCDLEADRFVSSVEGATQLPGDWFFIGTAHIHFGHFIVEGLARLWALEEARKASPNLRYISYESEVRPFAFELLKLAGIPREAYIGSPPLGCPEQLFVPSCAMRTHHWIAPEMDDIWSSISTEAKKRLSCLTGSRRIFLSRSSTRNRKLANESEVEQLFASFGFEIICPETLPIVQQVKLAADAEMIAGCVGSQTYLAAFQQKGGDNIILAPENFFLPDDVLIAQTKGHRLSVYFGGLTDFSNGDRWSIDVNDLKGFLENHKSLARRLAPC